MIPCDTLSIRSTLQPALWPLHLCAATAVYASGVQPLLKPFKTSYCSTIGYACFLGSALFFLCLGPSALATSGPLCLSCRATVLSLSLSRINAYCNYFGSRLLCKVFSPKLTLGPRSFHCSRNSLIVEPKVELGQTTIHCGYSLSSENNSLKPTDHPEGLGWKKCEQTVRVTSRCLLLSAQ